MNSKSIIGGIFLAISVLCAGVVYKVNGGDISKFLSSTLMTNIGTAHNIDTNYKQSNYSAQPQEVDLQNFVAGDLNHNKETKAGGEESSETTINTGIVGGGGTTLSTMTGSMLKENMISIIITFFGVILCAVFGAIGIGLLVMGDREQKENV